MAGTVHPDHQESARHALAKALVLIALTGAAIGYGLPILLELAAVPFR